MKIRVLLACLGSAVVGCLAYSICYCAYMVRIEGREASAISHLEHLRNDLFDYREKHGEWPHSLAECCGDSGLLDAVSGRPVAYFPESKWQSNAIVLAQPEPFRDRLWPFGELRKWGVQANGDVVSTLGEHDRER